MHGQYSSDLLKCTCNTQRHLPKLAYLVVQVATASGNRYVELQRDLLPGDVPNSPVRRLSYRIQHALTLKQLAHIYFTHRHKPQIFKDKHVSAILMRIPNLLYAR